MRTNWLKGLSIVALAAVALLVAAPASATCGTSIVFGHPPYLSCGGNYCYITSPGAASVASMEVTFWNFGSGSTAVGTGDDNGPVPDDAILRGPYPGGLTISGDWAGAAFDNCPDRVTTVPNQRQVFQFSDVSAAGNQSFFAVACVQRTPALGFQFNLSGLGQNIVLKPVPKASIVNTVRAAGEAQITVGSPDFSPLVYSDGSSNCNAAALIPQYDVWIKSVNRNAPAPTDRDTATGTWALGGTCAIGGPCTVTTACGTTNCDAYVAVSPKYNSGFGAGDLNTSARTSPNSTLVQAGPTLAEPPDFKIIPKKPAPKGDLKPRQ